MCETTGALHKTGLCLVIYIFCLIIYLFFSSPRFNQAVNMYLLKWNCWGSYKIKWCSKNCQNNLHWLYRIVWIKWNWNAFSVYFTILYWDELWALYLHTGSLTLSSTVTICEIFAIKMVLILFSRPCGCPFLVYGKICWKQKLFNYQVIWFQSRVMTIFHFSPFQCVMSHVKY